MVITTLLKGGADINADQDGVTPWTMAVALNENPEVIAAFLEAGADINAKDKDGMTPLMAAAMMNPNPEVIAILLQAGANVKAKDRKGSTAFDYAQKNVKMKNAIAYWRLKDAR